MLQMQVTEKDKIKIKEHNNPFKINYKYFWSYEKNSRR
jgi:hypothetical protein